MKSQKPCDIVVPYMAHYLENISHYLAKANIQASIRTAEHQKWQGIHNLLEYNDALKKQNLNNLTVSHLSYMTHDIPSWVYVALHAVVGKPELDEAHPEKFTVEVPTAPEQRVALLAERPIFQVLASQPVDNVRGFRVARSAKVGRVSEGNIQLVEPKLTINSGNYVPELKQREHGDPNSFTTWGFADSDGTLACTPSDLTHTFSARLVGAEAVRLREEIGFTLPGIDRFNPHFIAPGLDTLIRYDQELRLLGQLGPTGEAQLQTIIGHFASVRQEATEVA